MNLYLNKEFFMIENFMALFNPHLVIANERLKSVADIDTDKHIGLGLKHISLILIIPCRGLRKNIYAMLI